MLGWNTPELRGDEFTLDEDASKFFAEAARGHEDMSDVMDHAGRPRARTRRWPSCGASGRMW